MSPDGFMKHPSSETRLGCCHVGRCLGQPPPPQTRMHAGPLTSTHPLRAQRSQLTTSELLGWLSWQRCLLPSLMTCSSPEPTWWKERTDFHKLSIVLHTCIMACTYPPEQIFFLKRSQPPPPDKAKRGPDEGRGGVIPGHHPIPLR